MVKYKIYHLNIYIIYLQKTLAKMCVKINHTSKIEELSELNKISLDLIISLAVIILNSSNNLNDINALNLNISNLLKHVIKPNDIETEDINLVSELDIFKTELIRLGQSSDLSKISDLLNSLNNKLNIDKKESYNNYLLDTHIIERYKLLKILKELRCVDIIQSYQTKKHIISYINKFSELEDQYIKNILLMTKFLQKTINILDPLIITSELKTYYDNLKTHVQDYIYMNKNNGLQTNRISDTEKFNNIFILKMIPSNNLLNISEPKDLNLMINKSDINDLYKKLKKHEILPNGYIGSTTIGISNNKSHVNFILLSEKEIKKNDIKKNIDNIISDINSSKDKIDKMVDIKYDLSVLDKNIQYVSRSDINKIFSSDNNIVNNVLSSDINGNIIIDYSDNNNNNIIHELITDYIYDYFAQKQIF